MKHPQAQCNVNRCSGMRVESALRWPARTDQLIPLLQKVLGCVLISWACQGLQGERSKPPGPRWSRLWLLILCRALQKYRFRIKRLFTKKEIKCIINLWLLYLYHSFPFFFCFALLCGIFSIMGKLWFSAFSVLIWDYWEPFWGMGVRPRILSQVASVYPAKH